MFPEFFEYVKKIYFFTLFNDACFFMVNKPNGEQAQ